MPEGTVAGRLARARALLARRLAPHRTALSSAALAVFLSREAASASVPASVLSSTIKAVAVATAGQAATAVISAQVAALTEGVLKTMLLTKLKIVTAVMVTVSVVCFGGGLITHSNAVAQPGNADAQPVQRKRSEPATTPANAAPTATQVPSAKSTDAAPVVQQANPLDPNIALGTHPSSVQTANSADFASELSQLRALLVSLDRRLAKLEGKSNPTASRSGPGTTQKATILVGNISVKGCDQTAAALIQKEILRIKPGQVFDAETIRQAQDRLDEYNGQITTTVRRNDPGRRDILVIIHAENPAGATEPTKR
jgi:hypothetical protein